MRQSPRVRALWDAKPLPLPGAVRNVAARPGRRRFDALAPPGLAACLLPASGAAVVRQEAEGRGRAVRRLTHRASTIPLLAPTQSSGS